MKLGEPLLLSLRLWDQLRERIQCLHYSLNTGKFAFAECIFHSLGSYPEQNAADRAASPRSKMMK